MQEQDYSFDFDLLARHGIDLHRFSAGEKIFLEGDPGSTMYIVRSGKVHIITYGSVLENVGPGGIFGEIAIIDEEPRSAAAMAAEDTEVASIDKTKFLDLVREQPEFALLIMCTLARRVRRMNENL